MKLSELTTVEQLEAFLRGSQPCAYTVHSSKDECYQWIQGTLVQFRYMTLRKADKGIVIRYLMKISGYSRQQLTRLIEQYVKRGKIVRTQQTSKCTAVSFDQGDQGQPQAQSDQCAAVGHAGLAERAVRG